MSGPATCASAQNGGCMCTGKCYRNQNPGPSLNEPIDWPRRIHDTRPKRGGIEDDPDAVHPGLKPCMHPEHQPPGHMVIPAGKRYRHICPGCGFEVLIRSPQARHSA